MLTAGEEIVAANLHDAARSTRDRRPGGSTAGASTNGAVHHQVRERLLHEQFGLGIQRRRGLVHQDRRIAQKRGRSPPLTLATRQPLAALADDGLVAPKALMKSWALAARAAASISACVAFGAPYAMLVATVSSKSTVSCVTMPIWLRSDASPTSLMSTPSISMEPPVTS
jgi:hypothetical protein